MREKVLAGFEGGADFQPSESGPWLTRIAGRTAGR